MKAIAELEKLASEMEPRSPELAEHIRSLLPRLRTEERDGERAAWANGHYEGYDLGIHDASHWMVNYPATQKWAEAEAERRYP